MWFHGEWLILLALPEQLLIYYNSNIELYKKSLCLYESKQCCII